MSVQSVMVVERLTGCGFYYSKRNEVLRLLKDAYESGYIAVSQAFISEYLGVSDGSLVTELLHRLVAEDFAKGYLVSPSPKGKGRAFIWSLYTFPYRVFNEGEYFETDKILW